MSTISAPPEPPRSASPPPRTPPAHEASAPEPPRNRPVLRLLAGCLVALLCSAGIGATFVLEQVHTLRDSLKQNSALALPSGTLAPVAWGQPQTLLLVGDDQRALTKYYHQAVLPHSNEMLLVRIDPSKPYLSMMSIPRELEVTIYPRGRVPVTTRFNYAYTAGGIRLLVGTIQRVLGLSVNHVMVVTFGRFKRAVDAMGCVYSTVDRRYYHVNVPGGPQYQEIDLQPGYQDMCGAQALEFVSYRHDDTSIIRDARDQSFLLDVKQQYGPTLAANVGRFEHIFGQAVQTDRGLQSTTGLLNLIGTLISSAGRRVRRVQFSVNLVPPNATPCLCVTATPEQITASVHAFLFGSSPIPKRRVAAVARAVHNAKTAARLPLAPVPSAELSQARAHAGPISFPYEFPAVEEQGGQGTPVYFRDYSISAPDGSHYPIYTAVFAAGPLGQYYEVQGTTWTTAPLLDNAEQTVTVGARRYYLHYEGGQLQVVAWQERGAAYWIRNSLNSSVPNGDLLAIAEQTRPIAGATPAGGGLVRLGSAVIPTRIAPPPKTDIRQALGVLAALLALIAVPVMLGLWLVRRRELSGVRASLAGALAGHARVAPAMPAGGLVSGAGPGAYAWWRSDRGARDSRRPRLRAAVQVALAASAVAALAALAVSYLSPERSVHATPPRVVLSPRSVAVVPSVRVVVLNSTSTAGAAAALAHRLERRGVHVAGVGNLTQARPAGLWILYRPGHRMDALALARMVPGRVATLAPIDPVSEAAGADAAVAIVIA